jgi:hypothetical protein
VRRRSAIVRGAIVSDKSPRKSVTKKPGRTLKEKRSAKKLKKVDKTTPFLTPGR